MDKPDKKSIIEVTAVSKVFRVKTADVVVLKKVNLDIKENDFAVIFGPSGCGKSTLLHVLLGLEPPTNGQVHFFGYNLYGQNEDERSVFRKNHIGMIYQQPNWIRSLTVMENVAFAASLTGEKKAEAIEKAKKALKTVGMLDWADYLPTELSSGQQQKVSLARALITDPKVIIADEPTGNLDFVSGKELMELFQSLVKMGKTVIMVTHDIGNVDYASKVVQMFDGQVIGVFETKDKLVEIKKTLRDSDGTSLLKKVSSPQEHPLTFGLRDKKFQIPRGRLSIGAVKTFLRLFMGNAVQTLNFLALLSLYLGQKISAFLYTKIPETVKRVLRLEGFSYRAKGIYERLFTRFAKEEEKTIQRVDLIDLSIKNMMSKKTRTAITIGGMAIGIGAIVFLVSVGYGLEKLVVSRVARLEEMKQVDAIPAVASNVKITDKSLTSFKDISSVTKILPIIGVVGRVNFKNSNTDVAVYGVLSDYLKESAIKPVQGVIFTSNEITTQVKTNGEGQVAGVSTERETASFGDELGETEFSINPSEWLRVRDTPSPAGKLLGYTKRAEGVQKGTLLWGGSYISDDGSGEATIDEDGRKLGLWIKTKIELFEKKEGEYVPITEDEVPVQKEGYVATLNMEFDKSVLVKHGAVLGIATDSATTKTATSASLLEVEIASLSGEVQKQETTTVGLAKDKKREAVVNKAFLKVLGISENQALGKVFSVSFVATEDLTSSENKIVSAAIEYKIIGVTPDAQTPIIYVPLSDVKEMGLNYYSQVKLVTASVDDVGKTRKQVEALGMKTSSVVDTVAQINRLFGTLRLILGLLGIVALSVAALGMFNTLTISLLERTHEVGMMKAIGMRSTEVRDLFLTESMIMGFFGGVGGLLLGIAAGKIASILLSFFAVIKGVGFIDVTYVPILFILVIVFLSIMVGILTGIYPAHRATKISALDALRYE